MELGLGGSAVAKLCAEEGLKTLVLERMNLRREKVCSGVLTGKTMNAALFQLVYEEKP